MKSRWAPAGLRQPARARLTRTWVAVAAFLAPAAGNAATALPAPAVCRPSATAPPVLARLQKAMATGRFLSYQPISLQVINGRLIQADEASIRQDLQTLRPRFDSLITYGSINGAEKIPDIAAELGYRAVVMGIWDVADARQLQNVVDAARRHPKLVMGVSVGNETLLAKRETVASLVQNIQRIRQAAPSLAISTTEPFHLLVEESARPLLAQLDFMLVNVHPVFQPWFRAAPDKNAAEFVVNVVNQLSGSYCGPVLVKETGVPTAPAAAGFNAGRQASFYAALRAQFPPTEQRAFAYFAAFDSPWRVADVHPVPGDHPEEAWWGLYDAQRHPKPAALALKELKTAPGSFRALK
jgi:exo-beta-1,3-glucanase (GH17 family)